MADNVSTLQQIKDKITKIEQQNAVNLSLQANLQDTQNKLIVELKTYGINSPSDLQNALRNLDNDIAVLSDEVNVLFEKLPENVRNELS